MKLCINCRWVINRHPELPTLFDWRCNHATAIVEQQPNYVTGEPHPPVRKSCDAMRLDDRFCSPEGRYWEAKELQ
jgi:hypothetical protein